VVIMLVSDGERVLLGRRRGGPGLWSVLAGFLEPGETPEEAVVREVREEAGIEVDDVRYEGSQPWPFPGQIMLGFTARWKAGEPRAVDRELEYVRWFDREETRTALNGGGEVRLPGHFAIARQLIDAWLENGGGA
jgi:NAD+ diphosphatase